MKGDYLLVAGVRVVTDVFWEDRADQRFHLLRVNIGRGALSFLLHAHIVKDLQKQIQGQKGPTFQFQFTHHICVIL